MSRSSWGLIFAIGLMSTTAHAAGIKYDCDTTAGHFSELILPVGEAPFTVTGKLEPMNPAKDKEYVPLARLAVSNASDQAGPSNEGWAGFDYVLVPEKKGKIATIPLLEFSSLAKGQGKNETVIGQPSTQRVSFTIVYDGKKAEVSVDGHRRSIDYVAANPVVTIVCSTGEFLFTDLQIKNGE